MKKLFLWLVLLQGVLEVQATLSKEEKAFVVAGLATGTSLLWFWSREPNSIKVKRAQGLYKECQCWIGKENQFLYGDPEKQLAELNCCAILQKADDIMGSYSELKGRNNWFWNRSDDLAEALGLIKRLKKNLEEYQLVRDQLRQQIVVKQIGLLWSQLFPYNVHLELSTVVTSSTLNQLSVHPIMQMQEEIKHLASEINKYKSLKTIACQGFDKASQQIIVVKKSLDQFLNLINKIKKFDDYTAKYKRLLTLDLGQMVNRQNVILEARAMGNGSYPLIQFIEGLHYDIRALRSLDLQPFYIKFDNNYITTSSNSLDIIIRMLEEIKQIVTADGLYRDELRRREEQRRHEEYMRLEKERLRIERQRFRAEQERAWLEQKKIKIEIDKVYAKKDCACSKRCFNDSTQAELDHAYAQQEQQRKQNSVQVELDQAYADQERQKDPWW